MQTEPSQQLLLLISLVAQSQVEFDSLTDKLAVYDSVAATKENREWFKRASYSRQMLFRTLNCHWDMMLSSFEKIAADREHYKIALQAANEQHSVQITHILERLTLIRVTPAVKSSLNETERLSLKLKISQYEKLLLEECLSVAASDMALFVRPLSAFDHWQLKRWKDYQCVLLQQINDAKARIEDLKRERPYPGKKITEETTVRNIKLEEMEDIKSRIKRLSTLENNACQYLWERHFVDLAKQLLGGDLFHELITQAKFKQDEQIKSLTSDDAIKMALKK